MVSGYFIWVTVVKHQCTESFSNPHKCRVSLLVFRSECISFDRAGYYTRVLSLLVACHMLGDFDLQLCRKENSGGDHFTFDEFRISINQSIELHREINFVVFGCFVSRH